MAALICNCASLGGTSVPWTSASKGDASLDVGLLEAEVCLPPAVDCHDIDLDELPGDSCPGSGEATMGFAVAACAISFVAVVKLGQRLLNDFHKDASLGTVAGSCVLSLFAIIVWTSGCHKSLRKERPLPDSGKSDYHLGDGGWLAVSAASLSAGAAILIMFTKKSFLPPKEEDRELLESAQTAPPAPKKKRRKKKRRDKKEQEAGEQQIEQQQEDAGSAQV